MVNTMRRAQPWLGTLVDIRVDGLPWAAATRAIDAAFAEIATVHRCMSFHEAGSDLSALHAATPGIAVRVDARTCEVLSCALRVAAVSGGCFDPTVGAQLVAWGLLPRPQSPCDPDAQARWRDIELLADNRVRLSRPLWIDLGGVAKGYAVDRATRILLDAGASQVCVNAGGDLRVAGLLAERVWMRTGDDGAVVELQDAAIAGSEGRNARRRIAGRWHGPHVHGDRRSPAATEHAVSVVASTCMIADALTKVVLAADPPTATRTLAAFDAQAYRHEPRLGWHRIEAAA